MTQLVEAAPRLARVVWKAPDTGSSSDSYELMKIWVEAAQHFVRPSSRSSETLEQELARLADEWRRDTAHMSSVSDMASHSAYQRIIGKGAFAVPFLLRALEEAPDHWFTALTAITGVNPVAPDDEGNILRMAQAWITWGREQRQI